MKFEPDKKYLKVCVYAFGTVAALLLFNRLLSASNDIWQSFKSGLGFILTLLSPFIMAIVMAYILSPAVTAVEKLLAKLFKKSGAQRPIKMAALVIVYLLLIALIVGALSFAIPGIISNIAELIRSLPTYYGKVTDFVEKLPKTEFIGGLLRNPSVQQALDNVQKSITAAVVDFQNNTVKYVNIALTSLGAFAASVFSTLGSLLIGLVLSFYLLNERESIVYSTRHLLKARLGEKRSGATMSLLSTVDNVFGRYISAKLLTMVILFVLAQIAFVALGIPFSTLMAAIIALTNLVPYIGPFLGAVPPLFVALLISPMQALYVGIAILLLQAIDNYFITPYVIGDRMGLSPFWILLSIILGGGLFGVWGLLLSVPTAAVIKVLIERYIKGRALRRAATAPNSTVTGTEPKA